jgi:hypothetical protein
VVPLNFLVLYSTTCQESSLYIVFFLPSKTIVSFGFQNPSIAAAAATAVERVEPRTPWIAAADGILRLLQASLEQLELPLSAADKK